MSRLFFIARDRFGEKPLYYRFNNSEFHFASELSALKFPVHPLQLHQTAGALYLSCFYNPLQGL
jgi:asparagine synthase (glutamine-hydrolysing)